MSKVTEWQAADGVEADAALEAGGRSGGRASRCNLVLGDQLVRGAGRQRANKRLVWQPPISVRTAAEFRGRLRGEPVGVSAMALIEGRITG